MVYNCYILPSWEIVWFVCHLPAFRGTKNKHWGSVLQDRHFGALWEGPQNLPQVLAWCFWTKTDGIAIHTKKAQISQIQWYDFCSRPNHMWRTRWRNWHFAPIMSLQIPWLCTGGWNRFRYYIVLMITVHIRYCWSPVKESSLFGSCKLGAYKLDKKRTTTTWGHDLGLLEDSFHDFGTCRF